MIRKRQKMAGASFAPLVAMMLLCAPGLFAQDCEIKRNARGGALDEVTYRQLNAIYETVGEARYDEAYADLQRLLQRAGGNDYMAAIVNQAMAQVEWSRQNYDAALEHFEAAVALDTLPDEAHFALMYQVAQLYYMQERYAEALERLQSWFCTAPAEKITSAAHVLAASIHSSMENYPAALEAIDQAIALEADPREQWYQLKVGVHYQLGQNARVAETLESMVALWPGRKTYWVQLSQSYFAINNADKALATMALAWRKDLLDQESELVYLSNLYANAGVPFKAAQVLEQGIREAIIEPSGGNWARVAGLWYAAEELEKSLAAYEVAGQASAGGEIDLRRGYILVDQERWSDALLALDAALSKGGLEDREQGEAYLMRGMTQFNLGNLEEASANWRQASQFEPSRSAAMQWMAHLQDVRSGEGQ